MHQSLNSLIKNEGQKNAAKRRVASIADYLITILRIPEGRHLVMCFGKGDERSNRDALMRWVESIMNDYASGEDEACLEQITSRARHRIMDMMDEV